MNYLATEYFEKFAAAPPSHFGVSPTGHGTAQVRAFLKGYTPNKTVMLSRLGLAGAAMAVPYGEMVAGPLLVGASAVGGVRNTLEMNKQIARGKRVFGSPVAEAQAPAPAMPAAEAPIAPVQAPEKAAAMLSFPFSCNVKIASALGTVAGGLGGAALGGAVGDISGDMIGHALPTGITERMPPVADEHSSMLSDLIHRHELNHFHNEESMKRDEHAFEGSVVGGVAGLSVGGSMGAALGNRMSSPKRAAMEFFQSI